MIGRDSIYIYYCTQKKVNKAADSCQKKKVFGENEVGVERREFKFPIESFRFSLSQSQVKILVGRKQN